MRIFFATDIHGSDMCWRKFLNAGKFHKADVLIMGGDMTGKAMVPIVADGSGWEVTLQDQRHVLATEADVAAMEKRIRDRGYWLYDVDYDAIEVLIHPQSVVHSAVQFVDGSLKAQLGTPDMRLPIQYALSHPERRPSPAARADLLA